MKINLQLMILSINHSTPNARIYQVLVSQGKIPSVLYNGENSPEQEVLKLAEEYIEFNSSVYKVSLLNVLKEDDSLAVLYGLMIPDLFKIKEGGWKRMEDLVNDELVLQKYCQYIYRIN